MITPHFPPDSSAATHRVRLLAPYLEACGWKPTVLTVDPRFYEGSLDEGLVGLVPSNIRVERVKAIRPALSRLFGFGDLGLRSFAGLYAKAVELLSSEHHDLVYITVYPTYPALIGPLLKRKFRIPFVLDYQDPWVGAWGEVVGGGKNGTVDLRSRISRLLASNLEPIAVKAADGITAVSQKTADDAIARVQPDHAIPVAEIPIGGDRRDFEFANAKANNLLFDARDDLIHVVCIGTILPLGFETLRAFLQAVAMLRDGRPQLYQRLRIHFVGTGNKRTLDNERRVVPMAHELGVAEVVTEHPTRIDYLDSINVQVQASAILLLGSVESHYTASRLYPALLSGRPLLAVYHTLSTVSQILRDSESARIQLVEFDEQATPSSRVQEILEKLLRILDDSPSQQSTEPLKVSEDILAPHLAATLASFFDDITTENTLDRS